MNAPTVKINSMFNFKFALLGVLIRYEKGDLRDPGTMGF